MEMFEKLSGKLSSLGIRAFEGSVKPEKSWIAFAIAGKLYFVRFKSLNDITTLRELLDGAEATGENAEKLVAKSQGWSSLMSSVRDKCATDGVAWARAQWAKEKAAGKWAAAEARQLEAAAKAAVKGETKEAATVAPKTKRKAAKIAEETSPFEGL